MCGITGFWNFKADTSCEKLDAVVSQMAQQLFHRGPDDGGSWSDAAAGIALGHRRLSIIDLSAEGHQPMHSACGRFVIVFNGEIYNFRDLRADLEKDGVRFKGHSDTEIMLAGFVRWGIDAALRRFVGMFALALWDRQQRTLTVARDRIGEKPLYYAWMNGVFLFGSELKALRAHPAWYGVVDPDAASLMLQYAYVPAPRSIYKSVYKLLPGHFLTVKTASPDDQKLAQYWSLKTVVEIGLENPFRGSQTECLEALDQVLRQSIRDQMVSDVPLGAFLSGGVDSSAIVALMQSQSSQPVRTFTIGFHDAAFNEAERARAVAKHLRTQHTELYATEKDALDLIPRLPTLYDEPFGDSSQLPTYLVAKLTRQHVTVALSGDGGDELFAGYTRHKHIMKLWRLRQMPFRRMAAGALGMLPAKLVAGMLANGRSEGTAQVQKLARILAAPTDEDVMSAMVSHWQGNDPLYSAVRSLPASRLIDRNNWVEGATPREQLQYLDALTYLPDNILVKVDRATMGVSLESRAPFLDHRVVEFVWSIPKELKVQGNITKWILRELVYKYVPASLFTTEKLGFSIPLGKWLKGPLREWAESLLNEQKLNQNGLNGPLLSGLWRDHVSDVRDWQHLLWNVLMLQAWLEVERAAPACMS